MKLGKYQIYVNKSYGGGISWPFHFSRIHVQWHTIYDMHLLWVGLQVWKTLDCPQLSI